MRTRNAGRNDDMVGDMVKGALAGAVGVWALDKVTWWMWDREDPRALQQEREARPGGLDPAHVMANRAAEAMGKELTPKQPHPAGIAVHYGLGIMPGAAYGVLRNRVRAVGAAGGMLYGLALFLAQDEGLNPILGTSGKPTEYPPQAHLRGLVGHLVLGAATHATLNALDRVM
ncbi:MAG TPA: DUF1440 domain-containing protein [Longimicrobiaceae bacterium]|nr:DUF1440 domain-containing protein [Longimicrobiaceae bacterium]